MSSDQGNAASLLNESVLRWPTPKSRVWTTNFVHVAEESANILAIVAIGSAVRPRVRSADLDLIIICQEPKAIRDKPPIEVDLRVYRSSEVDALMEQGNDLLAWALIYGKALYQRDGFWDQFVARWKHRHPLPSFQTARRRADEAYRRLEQMLESGDHDAVWEQAVSYATHLARASILKQGQHPASRPELPRTLRSLGDTLVADSLERLLEDKLSAAQLLKLVRDLRSHNQPSIEVGTTSAANTAPRRSAGRRR